MWKHGTKLTINLLAGTGGAKNKREPGGSQNERESGINEYEYNGSCKWIFIGFSVLKNIEFN